MAADTMTGAERIEAALAFDTPDRTPLVPLFVKSTALNHCGVSQAAGNRDIDVALDCMLKTFEDFGGWDGLYTDMPDVPLAQLLLWRQPLKVCVPGVDLSDDAILQFHEYEAMTVDDYARVIEEGLLDFYYDDYIYRVSDLERGSADAITGELIDFHARRCVPEWERRGVRTYMGGEGGMHPFFLLSLMRSFTKFTEDLYFRPELVDKALRKMTDEWIENSLAALDGDQVKCTWLVEERASAFFYPLTVFERFWWPYTVEMVTALWSRGVVTSMHLDTDWSKNLPYFKRDLPAGSYVLQLDSTTDIFAAKELLRGHALFHGDLPAALQALGTPDEVRAYCRKLIDEVGYEGGFILGTGCETAPDFTDENFHAMVETVKTYTPRRRR